MPSLQLLLHPCTVSVRRRPDTCRSCWRWRSRSCNRQCARQRHCRRWRLSWPRGLQPSPRQVDRGLGLPLCPVSRALMEPGRTQEVGLGILWGLSLWHIGGTLGLEPENSHCVMLRNTTLRLSWTSNPCSLYPTGMCQSHWKEG